MKNSPFPHLNLLFKDRGTAILEGGGSANTAVGANKTNRAQHGDFLSGKASGFTSKAKQLRRDREMANLPSIAGGVPFLLQIPDSDDGAIEFISEKLGLELVAEYDDGFLIVASDDLELQKVIDLANDFARNRHGSGGMASILDVDDNPQSEGRIKRILEDQLFQKWPFPDQEEFALDVSIEVAAFGAPSKPRLTRRSQPETRDRKESEYGEKRREYFEVWDKKRRTRETEIESFVRYYQGEICSITDDSHVVEFPDSFSVRIRMNGKGFKDLIYNYPNLFEVTIPDNVVIPAKPETQGEEHVYDFELLPPPNDGPSICVIDSGMQENHRWLAAAVNQHLSRCFIPRIRNDDVADYVPGGGHGTRVAGVCLYPDVIVKNGQHQPAFWLLNARVLDENNMLLPQIFPAELLREIVAHYKQKSNVKIFQHSINSDCYCRLGRMSIWASAIDFLSHESDVLFIQSGGNLMDRGSTVNPGILDHLSQGRSYPEYLHRDSSRIANPAQSLQALTVGSISADYFQDATRRSMSDTRHPSSFSRTGLGMWESIKPEVVEFGGENAISNQNPPRLTTPPEVCPELIRSTMNGGPAFDRDSTGTSFSAPKVSHIAGHLASIFPRQHSLLYRALIVNSARWPEWAEVAPAADRVGIIRSMGYGIPNLSRATENTNNRITLITESAFDIKAKEGFIFGIPIPLELRRPGQNIPIRIDITLSYSSTPRRTRKSRRGYLGVWLDWKASKKRETFVTFRSRALKEPDGGDGVDDGNFNWFMGNKKDRDGQTDGVTRRYGTVQKDWTVASSYELPDVFGVVVRGHEGWDRKNPEAIARFCLVVSFEALEGDVRIYQEIRTAIDQEVRGQVRIGGEVQIQATTQPG